MCREMFSSENSRDTTKMIGYEFGTDLGMAGKQADNVVYNML